MASIPSRLADLYDTIDEAANALVLRAKWRYDAWDHLRIQPYRGYGTPDGVRLRARVLDDHRAREDGARFDPWHNVKNILRRIDSDDIPDARVRLHFYEHALEATSDDDGYVRFAFHPGALPGDTDWHTATLRLLAPDPDDRDAIHAEAEILVPPADAAFAVVSDLDDTVVRTGATSRLRMTRTVLLNDARSRTPFPGVGAFYRALHRGTRGIPADEPAETGNPIFYLSSSPWNFYDLFERFLDEHGLPPGPILLKDFGFEDGKVLKSGHESHKLGYIRRLMDTYPDLPFVLVGDSGQHDPEVYAQIVDERPDRVAAVYIRDVSADARDREVEHIEGRMKEQGVPTLLAETTLQAARHAADHGLIAPEAPEAVREAMEQEQQQSRTWRERLFG